MQLLPVGIFLAGAGLLTAGFLLTFETASALGACCVTGSFATLLLRP